MGPWPRVIAVYLYIYIYISIYYIYIYICIRVGRNVVFLRIKTRAKSAVAKEGKHHSTNVFLFRYTNIKELLLCTAFLDDIHKAPLKGQ